MRVEGTTPGGRGERLSEPAAPASEKEIPLKLEPARRTKRRERTQSIREARRSRRRPLGEDGEALREDRGRLQARREPPGQLRETLHSFPGRRSSFPGRRSELEKTLL